MTDPRAVTTVLVTYDRSALLAACLADLARLDPAPGRLIVVDNASPDDTPEVVAAARAQLERAGVVLDYVRLAENTGGSGGFHEGVRRALLEGCAWVWLTDDDVELLPDALGTLLAWGDRLDVVHGKRYDHDWTEFRWQPYLTAGTAIPARRRRPSPGGAGDAGYALIDSGTFEGMLVRAEVFTRVGLPDPRFFIVWDDVVFAWRAVQEGFRVGYVDRFVLRRRREQPKARVGARLINASSARHRYHVLRNRGHLANYLRHYGRMHRAAFGIGTALIAAKELVRLAQSTRSLAGVGDLVRGARDARAIRRDPRWAPMPGWSGGPAGGLAGGSAGGLAGGSAGGTAGGTAGGSAEGPAAPGRSASG